MKIPSKAAALSQSSLDAGAALALDLHLRHSRDDELVQAGITTAYVAVRSQGAIGRAPAPQPVQLPFPLPQQQGTPPQMECQQQSGIGRIELAAQLHRFRNSRPGAGPFQF